MAYKARGTVQTGKGFEISAIRNKSLMVQKLWMLSAYVCVRACVWLLIGSLPEYLSGVVENNSHPFTGLKGSIKALCVKFHTLCS